MRIPGILAVCSVVAGTGFAQEQPASKPDLDQLIKAWRRAEPSDVTARSELIEAMITQGRGAFERLGKLVARRVPAADFGHRERDAVEFVLRDLAVDYLQHVAGSGMHYAGQFSPLEPLQPWMGRMFCQLVVDTPAWFPSTMRVSVIPALRDLFPEGPDLETRESLRGMAWDEDGEPADLREALAYALAQWGDRSAIQPRLDEIKAAIGEGANVDELHFVQQLALAHYQMREYSAASKHWTRYLRGREALNSPPTLLEYYNAACAMSLSGAIPEALAELEVCGQRMLSGDADESQRIERKLFDTDPELRAVRSTPQFQRIVLRVYGKKGG